MRVKGRVWIGVWLAFGLAMFAWVVARDTAGFVAAGELEELRNRHSVLQAERASLLRRVRTAESRDVLSARAAALGLRMPADSEIVFLQTDEPEGR